jgi:hypothetical protein
MLGGYCIAQHRRVQRAPPPHRSLPHPRHCLHAAVISHSSGIGALKTTVTPQELRMSLRLSTTSRRVNGRSGIRVHAFTRWL